MNTLTTTTNLNNKIVKLNNEYYLLNSEIPKATRLTLTDTNGIEEVEGTYFIYLVSEEYKNGKCFKFDSINLASKMYNEYTCSLSDKYMQHSYIEQGITIDECFSYILWSDKNKGIE